MYVGNKAPKASLKGFWAVHVFSFHTTASCCKETAFRLQLYVTNFACTMNIFIIAFASN